MPAPRRHRRLYAIQPTAGGGPPVLEWGTSPRDAERTYRGKHPQAGPLTVKTHRQAINEIAAAGDDVAERNLADTELPRE